MEIGEEGGNIISFFNGGWQDSIFYSSKMGMLKISPLGEPLDTIMFPLALYNTYAGWSDASFKRPNGGYVVGGSVRSDVIDGLRRIGLFFFDPDGQPDSSIVMDMGSQTWIGRQVIETSDGNFLVCGEKFGGDAFIMKISPLGDILCSWSGGGPSIDYATSVAESPTGKYYMGGAKEFNGSNRDFWVKAFTPDGAVVWDTIWGSPYLENSAYVRIASDGELLVAGGYGVQAGNNKTKYIAKLDHQTGSMIWQNFYGPGGYDGSILSLKELPSGDLIGGGTHVLNGTDYVGVLLRTISTGDSLWMRYYYYEDSITVNGRGVFRDVEPTPDGGFVAVGTAFSDANYSQDVWVVKVDQYGCIEPGCHIITGMETQITNMREVLHVWPNPIASSGELQVQLELPDHFRPQGDLRLTITSSDGRLAKEERIMNSSVIQLPQLSPGHYHVHLSDQSRWISGAKLVVE